MCICSSVAEDGEHVSSENKTSVVAASGHTDIHKQVDELSTITDVAPFRKPVVAPALKNLGILCYC